MPKLTPAQRQEFWRRVKELPPDVVRHDPLGAVAAVFLEVVNGRGVEQ